MDITINYEDSDAAGVVYYANYLAFMERARNAWLRSLGYGLRNLAAEHQIIFAVRHATIDYHAPALIDDVISVSAEVVAYKGAMLTFEQHVTRDAQTLVSAQLKLVTLHSEQFKPRRVPEWLLQHLSTS